MANGYRKDSIFWALTLVAVGGLFLYRNFHPDFHAWQIIAKFWPILIIFWGLSKLYAYFKYRQDPSVPPGPFITGGEIVLLIFLLIVGSAISGIVNRGPGIFRDRGIQIGGDDEDGISLGNLFGNPYDFTEQVEATVKPKSDLEIPEGRGDVTITGWDQPKIQVVTKKRVYADDEKNAENRAAEIRTTVVDNGGGKYRIDINRTELQNKGYRLNTDFVIQVPKEMRVSLPARRGDVKLTGLAGDQTIESTRGDVNVSQIVGNVKINMRRGDLKVVDVTENVDVSGRGSDLQVSKIGGHAEVNGEFYTLDFQEVKKQARYHSSRTDLLAQEVDGRIHLEGKNLTARNINGPFTLKTRNKDVNLEDVIGPIRVDTTHGNVEVISSKPPKKDVEIQTTSESIELFLPKNAAFQIEGKTSGDIRCDFTAPSLKISKDQPSSEITGAVGKGGPTLRLNTTYGDIKISQR